MVKSYDNLNKQRIEKIRDLNPQETEAYIDSLNIKLVDALNNKKYDVSSYYAEKLKEANDILSQKYSNMDLVTSQSKAIILTIDLLLKNIDNTNGVYFSLGYMIMDKSKNLLDLKLLLDYIMFNYYFSYPNSEGSIAIENTLSLHLQYEYPKFEEFFDKAHAFVDNERPYDESFMSTMDNIIERIRDMLLEIIDEIDSIVSRLPLTSEKIDIEVESFEHEKKDVMSKYKEDKYYSILKEKGYLKVYFDYIDSLKLCLSALNYYKDIKAEVLDVIDGDSFMEVKSMMYYKSKYKRTESFEEYLKGLPTYNIRNLEFKKGDTNE